MKEAIERVHEIAETGQLAYALSQVADLAERNPDDPEVTYARGSILLSWRRNWEAKRHFVSLKSRNYRLSKTLIRLGWAHLGLGELDHAFSCVRQAVSLAPNDWEAHYALGEVLRPTDLTGAEASFSEALQLSPENVHCLVNLSATAIVQKDYIAAERYARRAVAASAASAPAWVNLGMALMLDGRLEEACNAFEQGEALTRDAPGSFDEDSNLGCALNLMGRTGQAIEYFRRVLPERPNVTSSGHYALALLTAGHFAEGWAQYEFRWFDPRLATQRARYSVPCWGGQDLRGKTILLRCEQGVGDVLQFVRYAPMVKALGATVWLELRPGLGNLACEFAGVDRLFPSGSVSDGFDFYADLLSLPAQFQTTLETIPVSVSYLRVPNGARVRWRSRLPPGEKLKIGLVWAGDPSHVRDRQRSIALDALEPLLSNGNVEWFSLQKGHAAKQLESSPSRERIVDLAPDLLEYADTAAAIEQLDLVITVDTSVAHLAGALGRPVWVMLPLVADWRWLDARDDSPWYPTMRLFRQTAAGEWSEVVMRVRLALAEDAEVLRAAVPGARMVTDRGRHERKHDNPSKAGARAAVEVRMPLAGRSRLGMIQYFRQPQGLARSLEYYGEFRESQVEVLRQMITPGAFVLEIGAGIGLQTIAVAMAVAPDGNVLAIENSTSLRRVLRQNIDANRVRCVEAIDAVIQAESSADGNEDHSRGSDGTRLACTVDELCVDVLDCVIVSDPDLVEAVLAGGAGTLWHHRPAVFLAMESIEAIPCVAARIRDFGYRCWRVDLPLFNPGNFNRREDDIFAGATALGIVAFPEEHNGSEGGARTRGMVELVGA